MKQIPNVPFEEVVSTAFKNLRPEDSAYYQKKLLSGFYDYGVAERKKAL